MSDTAFKIFGYLLVFLLGWQEKASQTEFWEYYIFFGLFFLWIYLSFSIRRLSEMKENYRDFDIQHKKHLDYYRKFIGIRDFEELAEDRKNENEKFDNKYRSYLSLLYVVIVVISLLILYFVFVIFLKFSLIWVIGTVLFVAAYYSILQFRRKGVE